MRRGRSRGAWPAATLLPICVPCRRGLFPRIATLTECIADCNALKKIVPAIRTYNPLNPTVKKRDVDNFVLHFEAAKELKNGKIIQHVGVEIHRAFWRPTRFRFRSCAPKLFFECEGAKWAHVAK